MDVSDLRAFVAEHRTVLLLTAVMVLALALRLYGLGAAPFWADEGRYAAIASDMVRDGSLLPRYPTMDALIEGKPPLQFYPFLVPFLLAGTPTEMQVRAVAAIAGVLTIPVLFLLTRRLFGTRAGLFAAGLAAIESNHLIYSRQAIPTMVGLLAGLLLLEAAYRVRERPDPLPVAGLAALGIAATQTHMMNLLVFLFVPLLFLVDTDDGRIRLPARWTAATFAAAYAALFALYRIMAVYLTPETAVNPASTVAGGPISGIIGGTYRQAGYVLGSMAAIPTTEYGAAAARLAGQYVSPSFLFLPLVAGVPAGQAIRRIRARQHGSTDLDAVLLGVLFAVVLLFLAVPAYALLSPTGLSPVRGHPFLLIPLLPLLGAALSTLSRRGTLGAAVPIALVLAYAAHLPVILTGMTVTIPAGGAGEIDELGPEAFYADTGSVVCSGDHYRPPFCFAAHPVGYDDTLDWRAATRHIDSRAGPTDAVFAAMAGPVLYYSDRPDRVRGLTCNVADRACDLMATLQSNRTTWIVAEGSRLEWQLSRLEQAYIRTNCRTSEVGGLTVHRCPP